MLRHGQQNGIKNLGALKPFCASSERRDEAAAGASLQSKLQILFPLPRNTSQAVSLDAISGFYYAALIGVTWLVDFRFIQANLLNASLFCACTDAHMRLAITPDGWLHLVVNEQQYQRLGLVGERILDTGR